jgi:hypothetical protein
LRTLGSVASSSDRRRRPVEDTVVNPPVNINTGVPHSTATLTVAANCARNATPIIVNGAFGNG